MPSISYAKCLVGLWAILLVILSFKQVFYVMGAVSVLLSISLLPTPDGDAKLLVPLFFLSERLLVDSTSLRHSPVMFLSCALFAYAADASQRFIISAAYGLVGIVAMYGLTSQGPLAFALGAYFMVALLGYWLLKSRVTNREAIIVSHLLGFLVCDAVVNTNVDPSAVKEMTITSFTHVGGRSSLLMALAVASCCFVAGKTLPLRLWSPTIRTGFFVAVTAVFTAIAFLYCDGIFKENPALWLVEYVGSSPTRFLALFAWCFGIPFAINVATKLKYRNSLPHIVHRKLFHLIAIIFFLPVGIYDPEYLGFSVMLATTIGILLEIARLIRLIGTDGFNRFMLNNIDGRDLARFPNVVVEGDSAMVIVRTHLYLLFGLAMPIVLHARQQQMVARPLAPPVLVALFIVPGLIGLGVMDAAAASVGTYWSRWNKKATTEKSKRIPSQTASGNGARPLSYYLCGSIFTKQANHALTHKTLVGSLGGLCAGALTWALVVLYVFGAPSHMRTLTPSIVGLVCGALFEATVDGVDNLELPIFIAGVIQTSVLILSQFF